MEALKTYVDDYLGCSSLSRRELCVGRAVRVVSCVRANDSRIQSEPSGFVWSVLVFSREGTGRDSLKIGLLSRAVARIVGMCVPEVEGPLEHAALQIAGASWTVEEYAVLIPRLLRWFSLSCGKASFIVGRSFRNACIRGYYDRIRNAAADEEGYTCWFEQHRAMLCELVLPSKGPLVSVLCPVYKTPPAYLRAMIDSVVGQTYSNWELVIINASPDDAGVCDVLLEYGDARIRVIPCAQNRGIAGNTNFGLGYCGGEYVCFLDHDDFVEPQALAAMMGAVESAREPVDLVYCDEDSIDESGCYKIPLFKPGRNIDLLYSNDYVIHWLMVSRYVLNHTTRSGEEVDGAQDYDLTLKAFECARGIVRVPYVLYHWRIHSGSMNGNQGDNPGAKHYAQESGRRAIDEHLKRRGITARVTREKVASTYRTDFLLDDGYKPELSCVVLGEPNQQLRDALAEYGRTTVDVLPSRTFAQTVIREVESRSTSQVVLVIAGDLELTLGDLERIAGYFLRPEVFAVSPRELRCDGLLECASCIVQPDGGICKTGHGLPAADEGYIGRLHRPYSAAVLNARCCAIRSEMLRNCPSEVCMFHSWEYALAALCLFAYKQGMVNVYTPFATVRANRGHSLLVNPWNVNVDDKVRLLETYRGLLEQGDPSHNPNFDPWSPHYKLR